MTSLRTLLERTPPEPGDRHIYNVSLNGNGHKAARKARPPGTWLLYAAAILLLGLAAAQGYVSWRAQYAFIFAAKHASVPAMLEALGLDTGAVIFALLGLAHARMGKPALIERALNLACAFGSMTMNLLGADLGSPRSVAVYVLPAVLYAACSDRLIATAGAAAGVRETSVWRLAGVTVLYLLRAAVALPSTATGVRRRLLELTPLPGPAGHAVTNAVPNAVPNAVTGPPESKKAVLLRLYATHPDRGDRSKVSKVAAELAPQAGLQPGSARTYLYDLHPTVDGTSS